MFIANFGGTCPHPKTPPVPTVMESLYLSNYSLDSKELVKFFWLIYQLIDKDSVQQNCPNHSQLISDFVTTDHF